MGKGGWSGSNHQSARCSRPRPALRLNISGASLCASPGLCLLPAHLPLLLDGPSPRRPGPHWLPTIPRHRARPTLSDSRVHPPLRALQRLWALCCGPWCVLAAIHIQALNWGPCCDTAEPRTGWASPQDLTLLLSGCVTGPRIAPAIEWMKHKTPGRDMHTAEPSQTLTLLLEEWTEGWRWSCHPQPNTGFQLFVKLVWH